MASQMMFRLFVLVCCCLHVSCAFPTGTSWASSRSPSSMNLAVQDAILEGLGMQVGNNKNGDGEIQNGDANTNDVNQQQQVPFIIQKIGRGEKEEIEEITNMCIDVFFNEQDDVVIDEYSGKKKTAPWKALQLAYLRNFQTGEILARNAFKRNQLVDLIVARRVYPVADASNINGNRADLVEEGSQIYNIMDQLDSSMYMTGEIIGYCEVSEKNFGLGGNFETTAPPPKQPTKTGEEPRPTTSPQKQPSKNGEEPRPYLSNLSVVEYARQSGVGSRLLDACEEAVRSWDAGHTEIVLQVEEDNPTAIQFYKRRGWEFVFADPTCRRYDTSGFMLKETRITKYAMVKRLDSIANGSNGDEGEGESGSSFIQKLKKSFFVQ